VSESQDGGGQQPTAAGGSPALKVFLSYRHEDTPGPERGGHAHHLYGDLARRFGADNVFIDVDTLKPGVPWQVAIDAYIAECDVLLALIGEEWLTISDAKGRRRLDDSHDVHRREIEAALARKLPVIPMLVEAAQPLAVEALPSSLVDLADIHGAHLSHKYWRYNVADLVAMLERIAAESAAREIAKEERERLEREQAEPERAAREAAAQAAHERAEQEQYEQERRQREQDVRDQAARLERERAQREEEAAAAVTPVDERPAEECGRAGPRAGKAEDVRTSGSEEPRSLLVKDVLGRMARRRRSVSTPSSATPVAQVTPVSDVGQAAQATGVGAWGEGGETAQAGTKITRRRWRSKRVLVGAGSIALLASAGILTTMVAGHGSFPSAREKQLLAHVPTAIRPTCKRGERDELSVATVACDLTKPSGSVSYNAFANQGFTNYLRNLTEWYDRFLPVAGIARAGGGDCSKAFTKGERTYSFDRDGERTYSIGRKTAGRFLCFFLDGKAPTIVWTDAYHRIGAVATTVALDNRKPGETLEREDVLLKQWKCCLGPDN
jgi:hypothetical protein